MTAVVDKPQLFQIVAICLVVVFLLVWSIPAVDRWLKKRARMDRLVVDIEQLWKTRDVLQSQLHWAKESGSHKDYTALMAERGVIDQSITALQRSLDELEGTIAAPKEQPKIPQTNVQLPTSTNAAPASASASVGLSQTEPQQRKRPPKAD